MTAMRMEALVAMVALDGPNPYYLSTTTYYVSHRCMPGERRYDVYLVMHRTDGVVSTWICLEDARQEVKRLNETRELNEASKNKA